MMLAWPRMTGRLPTRLNSLSKISPAVSLEISERSRRPRSWIACDVIAVMARGTSWMFSSCLRAVTRISSSCSISGPVCAWARPLPVNPASVALIAIASRLPLLLPIRIAFPLKNGALTRVCRAQATPRAHTVPQLLYTIIAGQAQSARIPTRGTAAGEGIVPSPDSLRSDSSAARRSHACAAVRPGIHGKTTVWCSAAARSCARDPG